MQYNRTMIKHGYVRVSKILEPYTDFSMIPVEILTAKANIGTEVHDCIEGFYKGELLAVTPRAQEYLEAFRAALKDDFFSTLEPLCIDNEMLLEKRFYDDDTKITGKIDMIASTPEGKNYLIDYKTTAATNLPYWKMQTALYSMLIYKDSPIELEGIQILHLKKKGKFSLIPMNLSQEDMDLALSLVKAYWHFKR